MNIYLCGFMGSGKTTLWKRLIKESGKSGFDFDEELAKRAGILPEELGHYIESIGWESFRSLECELFKESLENFDSGLFAFGGGTLTAPGVVELLAQQKAKVYWVNTPVEVCWERVKNETHRPLVKLGKDAFFKLYGERQGIYSRFPEAPEDFEKYL